MHRALVTWWHELPFVARLMTLMGLVLLVAGALMLIVFAGQQARAIRAELTIELARELEALPPALTDAVVAGDFASLQQQLDRLATRPQVSSVKYSDISGRALHSQHKPPDQGAPDWFIKGLALEDLTARTGVLVGSRVCGTVHITVGAQSIGNHVWRRLLNQYVAVLLIAGLDFLGLWLVLGHGLAPLKRLECGAKAMAGGALETRLTIEGSTEIRHLIAAFNHMAAATQDAQARLQQVSAELQRFSEVTAHHLQEPARLLASYAERLRAQLASQSLSDEAQLSLGFIDQQARRMKHLLAAVERYLAADQPRGKMEQTDVGKTVELVLERRAGQLRASRCGVTAGNLPTVWIDPPRLFAMVEELLDNALQFGVPLTADTPPHLTIAGERHGAWVRVQLSDNGPGIEAQYRERVFRVFERLGSSNKGTGIGLAMVRRMAQSCGGRAWIEASPDGGCCVLIELPAEKPA